MEESYITLSNIGFLYDDIGEYALALEHIQNTLRIVIQLGIENTTNAENLRKTIEELKSKLDMIDNPQNYLIG